MGGRPSDGPTSRSIAHLLLLRVRLYRKSPSRQCLVKLFWQSVQWEKSPRHRTSLSLPSEYLLNACASGNAIWFASRAAFGCCLLWSRSGSHVVRMTRELMGCL